MSYDFPGFDYALDRIGRFLNPPVTFTKPPDGVRFLRDQELKVRDGTVLRCNVFLPAQEGRYPAIALDRHKRPVDTLTSNIGHLLGTGILDPDDEAHVAALLRTDSLSSGYGIRTMSTGAAGYWPLAYHGGSVWAHDTAIAVHGMTRAGLPDDARAISDGLLAAAEGFGYRMPELHAGDSADRTSVPTPYPAACRPQAWSAAAAVAVLAAAEAATAAP